jgi:undecaprenyl-diphosphatase
MLVWLLIAGFGFHLFYLNFHCPIDLSGDEAQYWDWSRHLDLCYYSKGPVIAYIIRASCVIFGDTMQAVRLPALLLSMGSTLLTYLLARKLFNSDRIGLFAATLNHLVPVFLAGSLLMTIDSPLFFCWALATYLAAVALFDGKRWAWPLIGLVVGVGALAKYAMLLWLPLLAGAMLVDRDQRRLFRTAGPYVATVIALLCMTPVVLWNARHGWVSLRHVAHQTGAAGGEFSVMNILLLLASQVGVVGPTMTVLMIAAIVDAVRRRIDQPQAMFLAFIGVGFFTINFLDSFHTKVQVNWPAPAYFTLVILTAGFIARQTESAANWRRWRGWVYATVALGVVFIPIGHYSGMLIPVTQRVSQISLFRHLFKDRSEGDLLTRMRGWHNLGDNVTADLATLPAGSFVMCDDYQQTGEMAFYVQGRPTTYCAGAYFGKRLSQYDMWDDHRLDRTSPLVGHDAVYVGKGGPLPPEISDAFASIEPRQSLDITVCHAIIHTFYTYRCHDFKGFDALAPHSSSDSF